MYLVGFCIRCLVDLIVLWIYTISEANIQTSNGVYEYLSQSTTSLYLCKGGYLPYVYPKYSYVSPSFVPSSRTALISFPSCPENILLIQLPLLSAFVCKIPSRLSAHITTLIYPIVISSHFMVHRRAAVL